MKHEAIRKALEMVLGRREALVAIEGAAAQPGRISSHALRSEKAMWF